MKPTLPITSWQHIFLDTSFIIDFLSDPARVDKNPPLKQRIALANKVMDILTAYDVNGKQPRRNYYISAITVSELRKSAAENIAKELVIIFSAGDVNFVDYSKDIALLLNHSLETTLPVGQKHQFIAHLEKELKARNCANARQWVSDDLKIIASAKSVKRLDAVLTSDKNTFKVSIQPPCSDPSTCGLRMTIAL
jgi:hypothetical protein